MINIWNDMFVLGLPVLEKIIRSVVVYIFLIIGLRLAGKRELAQLNPFDLVVLLTLSNTVQNAIIGNDDSVTGGLIGAATLLLINFIVVQFLFKHPKLEHMVEGNADLLIHRGKIIKPRLQREMISEEELEVAARRQGFSDLSQVETAILEPSGFMVFIEKKPIPSDVRHHELMSQIKSLSDEIKSLKGSKHEK